MSWHDRALQLLSIPVVVTTNDNVRLQGTLLHVDEPNGGVLILTSDASGVRWRTYVPGWRINSIDPDHNTPTHRPA